MKTFTTFCLFVMMGLQAFACTFAPQPFCYTASYYSTTVVLRGVFADSLQNGIRVDVLDVYRGTESRSTITIWDGIDIDCNGTFPMNAHYLGNLSDTMILVLPVIDTIKNNWEVLGDYRSSYIWFFTPSLIQRGDSVMGRYQNQQMSVSLSDFISNINQCTNQPVGVDHDEEPLSFDVFPNPAADKIFVRSTDHLHFTVSLYDIHGKAIMMRKTLGASMEISLENLSPGLYSMVIVIDKRRVTKKVLVVR